MLPLQPPCRRRVLLLRRGQLLLLAPAELCFAAGRALLQPLGEVGLLPPGLRLRLGGQRRDLLVVGLVRRPPCVLHLVLQRRQVLLHGVVGQLLLRRQVLLHHLALRGVGQLQLAQLRLRRALTTRLRHLRLLLALQLLVAALAAQLQPLCELRALATGLGLLLGVQRRDLPVVQTPQASQLRLHVQASAVVAVAVVDAQRLLLPLRLGVQLRLQARHLLLLLLLQLRRPRLLLLLQLVLGPELRGPQLLGQLLLAASLQAALQLGLLAAALHLQHVVELGAVVVVLRQQPRALLVGEVGVVELRLGCSGCRRGARRLLLLRLLPRLVQLLGDGLLLLPRLLVHLAE